MEETKIRSISVASFLEKNGLMDGDIYYGGCLLMRNRLGGVEELRLFRHPIRIDAAVAMVCVEGAVDILCDMKRFRLRAGSLFIRSSGSIIQVEAVHGAVVCAGLWEPDFIRSIDIDVRRISRILLRVTESPLFDLDAGEWESLKCSLDEIGVEASRRRTDDYSLEVLRSMMCTLVYKICRVIYDKTGADVPQPVSGRSRSEVCFHEFFALLSRYYTQQRSVGFYAGRMHLTPKYLTTVIRQVSGRPAIEWINDYVIFEAKNLLKYSTLNVQQIAYALNFSNQSFFGRYFRNHTGQTPSAYRGSK